jgi:sortase A
MKKNIFGSLLIIIGLSIIGSALFMRYSAEQKQKAMIENFQKSLQEIGDIEDTSEVANVNPQDNSNAGNTTSTNDSPNSEKIKTMAIMVIPKINLNVAVAEGTDNQTLKYAVGHFEGTAMPGEKGNFSVAGHRSYTYSQYFNRLEELKVGDEIIVRTKNGEFTYVVYETFVVEPTEISVLDETKDATVTLITCTPIRAATHRLIVKGRLKV